MSFYKKFESIFHAAADLPPGERSAYIDAACGEDAALRSTIKRLLLADEEKGHLVDRIAEQVLSDSLLNKPLPPGCQIGSFRILRLLGMGGMGSVYEAEQELPRRTVALKLIHPGIATPSVLRRFKKEVQFLGALKHSGIAQIYEAGTHDAGGGSLFFFAMEYIANARNLVAFAEEKALSSRERLQLFAKVCEAVQVGHNLGIIHRDLKPDNLLIDAVGNPKIIDFGIARSVEENSSLTTIRTSPGHWIGTPQYMSPEQCQGDPQKVGRHSDVYALGVVLYELLTGSLPYSFASNSISDISRTICDEEPEKPSSHCRTLRGDLDTILLKALEKEPERRYPSALDLQRDIELHLQNKPIQARSIGRLRKGWKFCRRHPAMVGSTFSVIITLLAGTIVSTIFLVKALREEMNASIASTAANLELARAELERDRSSPAHAALNRIPEGQRMWEWRHLESRLDFSIATAEFKSMGGALQFLGENRLRFFDIPESNGGALRAIDLDVDSTGWEIREAKLFTNFALAPLDVHPNMAASSSWVVCQSEKKLLFFDPVHPEKNSRIQDRLQNSDFANAAFSPDGKLAAGNLQTTQVRIFELESGESVHFETGHDGDIQYLCFSPDGKRLCSGGQDGIVRLWDIEKWMEPAAIVLTAVLKAHDANIQQMAFDPKSSELAVASMDGSVTRWDIKKCERDFHLQNSRFVESFIERIAIDGMGATSVSYHPSGDLLACGSGAATIQLIKLRTPANWNKPVSVLRGHNDPVLRLLFSPDGRWLVSQDKHDTIKLWPAGLVQDVAVLKGHQSSVFSAAFLPGGETIVTVAGDGTIRVWDTRTLSEIHCLEGFEPKDRELRGVVVGHNGKFLAACSSGNWVHLWSLGDRRSPRMLGKFFVSGVRNGIRSIALSPSETRLAFGCGDGTVRVFESSDGWQAPRLLHTLEGHGEPVRTVKFLREEQLISGSSVEYGEGFRGSLCIWDLNLGRQLWCLQGTELGVWDVAVRSRMSGLLIATAEARGTVGVWDASNPAGPRLLYRLSGHGSTVLSVEFHPTEYRLVSGSWDRAIKVWDLVQGKELVQLNGHLGPVTDLVFSSDGKTLASASAGLNGLGNFLWLWESDSSNALRAERARR